MKRIITILFAFMLSFGALYAQKDVTRFLDIPVDGTKSAMIQKLKAKGFKHLENGSLVGEFNGSDVSISIVTNNNKVWRIVVLYQKKVEEAQVKIKFNKLFDQFSNNDKYIHLGGSKIDYGVNLYNSISFEKKEYTAGFYQKSKFDINDENISKRLVWFGLSEKYGKYDIRIYYDNLYNEANGEDL